MLIHYSRTSLGNSHRGVDIFAGQAGLACSPYSFICVVIPSAGISGGPATGSGLGGETLGFADGD